MSSGNSVHMVGVLIQSKVANTRKFWRARPDRIYPTVSYMETDMDEGGSCKRFTYLAWIRYGSPTECFGDPRTGLEMFF